MSTICPEVFDEDVNQSRVNGSLFSGVFFVYFFNLN